MTKVSMKSKSQLILKSVRKSTRKARKPKMWSKIDFAKIERNKRAVMALPLAVASPMRASSRFKEESIHHRLLGPGIRIRGTQTCALIGAGLAGNNPFVSSTTLINRIPINPAGMGQNITYLAAVYSMYRFRSVTVRYVPSCGSASVGALRLSLQADGASLTLNRTSFSDLSNFQMTASGQAWSPFELRCPNAPGLEEAYYTYATTETTLAAARLTKQLQLYGAWDRVFADSPLTVMGNLEIDFVLDLYNMSPPGYSLSASPLGPTQAAMDFLSLPSEDFEEMRNHRARFDESVEKIRNVMDQRLSLSQPSEQKSPAVRLSDSFAKQLMDVNIRQVNGIDVLAIPTVITQCLDYVPVNVLKTGSIAVSTTSGALPVTSNSLISVNISQVAGLDIVNPVIPNAEGKNDISLPAVPVNITFLGAKSVYPDVAGVVGACLPVSLNAYDGNIVGSGNPVFVSTSSSERFDSAPVIVPPQEATKLSGVPTLQRGWFQSPAPVRPGQITRN